MTGEGTTSDPAVPGQAISGQTISGQNPALPEIHGYKLLRVLGNGGMSTVYLARQNSLGREVAVKVMLPDALTDETSRRRFENEARTIARLDHPHIVGIFEVGRTRDGLPYYAMPYLPKGHLGQRPFVDDPAKVRATLHTLLSALEYAHSRGTVHRDVKAENVLFDEGGRPLLADFGIALRRGHGTRVTTAGLAVGSTAYMPPEQARGHSVDGRADLYSVGVLGWEMLTGSLPYNAGDALSMALQHAQEPIPKLPPRHRQWQKFFDRALAKTPEQRYPSARDMRAALDLVPDHPPAQWLGGRVARLRPSRRAWWGVAAALALAAVAAGLLWNRDSAGEVEEFVRVATAPARLPAPVEGAASAGALGTGGDAVAGLMRPLPESAAEPLVAAAENQLRQQRLTAPPGDNAFDSLMAALEADAAHPRLSGNGVALVGALADRALAALKRDDVATATAAVERARRVAERIALPRDPRVAAPQAIVRMDTRLEQALRASVAAAAGAFERDQALRQAGLAKPLGLPPARAGALLALARAVPTNGQPLPGAPGWTLVRAGGERVAIADGAVSRADYARFAEATRRPTALCRQRGSLLRIVAPRDWKSPGFAQTAQQPVVCVSWQDATAYAQWLGQRDGRRYRLASPPESQAAPATQARAVAAWTDACGGTCATRVASGRGWRGGGGNRALEGDRGYDDVGFRLVREL